MPATELLTIRVPPALKRWIEDEAYRRRLSMNRALVVMLTELAWPNPLPPTQGHQDVSASPQQAEQVTGTWIVDGYNAETPPDHPKHTLPLSPARLKRATEYARRFPDPAFWHAVFAEVWRSPWMQGQRASRDHRAIKRDLFWMMQTEQGGAQENCVKVYEGKYRDDGSPGTALLARLSEKERRTAEATQRILAAEEDQDGAQRQNPILHAVEQDGRHLL